MWNDDYYDKNGNKLSTSDGDQAVYDKDGMEIGYLDGSTVYDNNSNRLSGKHDDDEPGESKKSIFGWW